MDTNFLTARENVAKARAALRRGDQDTARDLGEKAVLLVPEMEDAWLVLVAADSNPEDALAYAQKALQLKPDSPRARKAVEWAMKQLKEVQAGHVNVMAESVRDVRSETPVSHPMQPVVHQSPEKAQKKSNRRTLLYAGAVLGLVACVVLGFAGWSAINNPAFASMLPMMNSAPTQEQLWAEANVPKPSVTPIDVSAFAPQQASAADQSSQDVTDAPTAVPTEAPTDAPTLAPTDAPTATSVPTEAQTVTPEVTETPGVMTMDIVVDTPTSQYVAPTAPPPAVVAASGSHGNARWIDVDLTHQAVYAYEGDTVVNSFIVSTGTWLYPTVVGQYKIYVKIRSGNMSGPGYFLPNVPYIMYFYKGYGLHGTYWHHNFGTPMSHGCVNLRTSDAEWLFNWASVGTLVNVHY